MRVTLALVNLLFWQDLPTLMCRWCATAGPNQRIIGIILCEQTLGNLVHYLLVILAREQMPVPVHSDLQRSMAGECLNGLRREPGFYPTGHGEVPKRVPIETTGRYRKARGVCVMRSFKVIKKSTEAALHQVVMTCVVALVIWKN
jgi:hypothetical protein